MHSAAIRLTGALDKSCELLVDQFTANGGLVVAAAGNDGNSVRSYPAGYKSVMMIGANDANNRWMLMSGQPEAVDDPDRATLFFTLQDVTERRRSEDQLRLLEKAVASLNDMVLITEAEPVGEPGPRIVFVNEAFERMTGYAREEVLGRSPRLCAARRPLASSCRTSLLSQGLASLSN